MLEHLPALQVVVPLMAAPLIVLVRNRAFAWVAATAASWACLAIAAALAWRVADAGVISYAIGSWPPPWGIEYRVDALNAFVLVLVSLIAALVAPYAWKSVAAEIEPDRQYLLYAMYCLCLAGLLGMAITGDAFNIFVFLEISSLAMYVLIAMGPRGAHTRVLTLVAVHADEFTSPAYGPECSFNNRTGRPHEGDHCPVCVLAWIYVQQANAFHSFYFRSDLPDDFHVHALAEIGDAFDELGGHFLLRV